ncbi:MAG: YggS family pyridoxal phosphate-dependent enzyme [bacterium]
MGLKENYEVIKRAVAESLKRSGRTDFPLIIAVTKTIPLERIVKLKEIGIKDLGENYVQELLSKMKELPDLNWHFIGTLQKNKAKYITGEVLLIHSVDNLSLAEELNKRASKRGLVQQILIQINQGEETKGGVRIDEAESLISELNKYSNIKVKGLMAMPPFKTNPEEVRPYFKEVRELRDYLNKKAVYKELLTELSMGMSSDYAVAVEEGSTILRIGTALFGERKK